MFHHLSRQELTTHVKVLGWLVFVSGLLGLLGAMFMFLVIVTVAMVSGDPDAQRILPLVATGIAGFMGLFSGISLLAGYGLITVQPWGRVLGLVDGFLGLMWFPTGTLLGLYAFWVLLQAEAEPYFSPAPAPAVADG